MMSHKKFGPDRFSRFDVYWAQMDRQTDKQNFYIDNVIRFNGPYKILFFINELSLNETESDYLMPLSLLTTQCRRH